MVQHEDLEVLARLCGSSERLEHQVWEELFPAEQARIVKTLIERITVRRDGISIEWKLEGMTKLLRDTVSLDTVKEAA